MNKFEQIQDFIDGTLSHEEEERLFSEFSSNEEMRTEFKQQLAISSAIKSDVKAFTPKAESTLKIFNALGFAPVPVPAPSVFTRLKGFYAGNAPAIWTGLAASFATALVFLSLMHTGIIGSSNAEPALAQEQNIVFELPVVESYVPDEFGTQAQTKGNNFTNADHSIPKNTNSNSDRNSNIYGKMNENTIVDANQNKIADTEAIDKPVKNYTLITGTNSFNGQTQADPSVLSKFNTNSNDFTLIPQSEYQTSVSELINASRPDIADNFILEFSGAQYFNSETGNMHPSEQMLLNNTNLSLLYEINKELYFGFSYTRENFYMKFRGIDFGVLYEYEQNPNLQTLTAILRYAPEWASSSLVSPFVSMSLGGNILGPVARGALGTKISMGANSYLLFSADYSAMWFEHQRAINNSGKLGINAGFGIDF